MTRFNRSGTIVATVVLWGQVGAAAAATLAPVRASDVVNLVSGGVNPLCQGGSLMGIRIGSDATEDASFAIPAGEVLVVTELRVQSFTHALTPGSLIIPGLFDGNTAQDLETYVPAVVNQAGDAAAVIQVSDLIIKPGVVLCTDASPANSIVSLKGFLAKDR